MKINKKMLSQKVSILTAGSW